MNESNAWLFCLKSGLITLKKSGKLCVLICITFSISTILSLVIFTISNLLVGNQSETDFLFPKSTWSASLSKVNRIKMENIKENLLKEKKVKDVSAVGHADSMILINSKIVLNNTVKTIDASYSHFLKFSKVNDVNRTAYIPYTTSILKKNENAIYINGKAVEGVNYDGTSVTVPFDFVSDYNYASLYIMADNLTDAEKDKLENIINQGAGRDEDYVSLRNVFEEEKNIRNNVEELQWLGYFIIGFLVLFNTVIIYITTCLLLQMNQDAIKIKYAMGCSNLQMITEIFAFLFILWGVSLACSVLMCYAGLVWMNSFFSVKLQIPAINIFIMALFQIFFMTVVTIAAIWRIKMQSIRKKDE